jgi:hypothetical protein
VFSRRSAAPFDIEPLAVAEKFAIEHFGSWPRFGIEPALRGAIVSRG